MNQPAILTVPVLAVTAATASVGKEEEGEPAAKKKKLSEEKEEEKKTIDNSKEAAIEAEVQAARQRAVVPLEIRMKQFRDMLAEKAVSTGGPGWLHILFIT